MVDSINFYNNVAKLMDNTIEETRKIIKELPKQETEGEVSVSPGRALTPKKVLKNDVVANFGEPDNVRIFRSADQKSILVTTEYSLKREITDTEFHIMEKTFHTVKSNSQQSLRRV